MYKEKNPRFSGLKREKFAKQFNFSLQEILKMHKLKRIQSKACKKLLVEKIIELFFYQKSNGKSFKEKDFGNLLVFRKRTRTRFAIVGRSASSISVKSFCTIFTICSRGIITTMLKKSQVHIFGHPLIIQKRALTSPSSTTQRSGLKWQTISGSGFSGSSPFGVQSGMVNSFKVRVTHSPVLG